MSSPMLLTPDSRLVTCNPCSQARLGDSWAESLLFTPFRSFSLRFAPLGAPVAHSCDRPSKMRKKRKADGYTVRRYCGFSEGATMLRLVSTVSLVTWLYVA